MSVMKSAITHEVRHAKKFPAVSIDDDDVGMSANYTYPGSLHGDDSQHIYMVLRKKGDAAPTVQKF